MIITTNDMRSNSLKRFVHSYIESSSTKIVNGYLMCEYDTEDIKDAIQKRINRHKNDKRYSRHTPTWVKQLKEIEGLENGNRNNQG